MEPNSAESANQFAQESSAKGKSEPTEPINREEIAPPSDKSGKDECYLLLAQVNLLRIRKQTKESLELCESALARWPHRPDAHALMGDLYHESGRIDDAILRFCRALELEPKNKQSRRKLAEMVRLKRTQLPPALSLTPTPHGLRLDRFARAIILALATIMLVTIMITPLVSLRRKAISANSGLPITVDRRINLDPIVLQPATPEQTPTDPDSPSTQSDSVIRDPVEQALVDLMSNDKSLLQDGVQVLDAEEDPSNDGFSITFLDRPAPNSAGDKENILRNCLLVAQSASTRFGTRDIRQFSIRCLLLSTALTSPTASLNSPIAGTTGLVFVGTIQRTAIPSESVDLSSQTEDVLQSYFTNPWWSSDLQ